ncbi:ComF family protein [Ectothiorhodospiraceae bacterium BW-2]|nr:ComF family protein [Ectothiorhodospiraceae bacterium BW-2]
MRTLIRQLPSRLFPSRCLLCGSSSPLDSGVDNLCRGCFASLRPNVGYCQRCALPIHAESAQICSQCSVNPPLFSRIYAPWLYQAPLKQLIIGLKFQHQLSHAPLLAELMALTLPRPLPDLLLPIPLHHRRMAERGFNQTEEIGRHLAKLGAIDFETKALRRIRPTQPQTTLHSRTARQLNLRGVFATSPRLTHWPQRIALLDDVVTTATTVNEAVSTLLNAGATTVEVWAVARATFS